MGTPSPNGPWSVSGLASASAVATSAAQTAPMAATAPMPATAPLPSVPSAVLSTIPTPRERLLQLKELFDEELISKAEFDAKRKELLDSPDTWLTSSSATPYRFMHFQTFSSDGTSSNLALSFPGNQENKMAYLMIEATGERLSAATDVPLLPPQFHDTIVTGAIVRLMESNVQVENAVVAWQHDRHIPTSYAITVEGEGTVLSRNNLIVNAALL
jgi:hypothetical protein